MCDTFTIEVDDSEILLGNGRVDLSADKWCHTVCELRRAQAEIERLQQRIERYEAVLREIVRTHEQVDCFTDVSTSKRVLLI